MADALSHAAGLTGTRPPEPKVMAPPTPVVSRRGGAAAKQPPSRVGKKPITGFFDPAVSKQLKKLALDEDSTVQDLVREALNDLFRKNNLPPIA